MMNTLLKSPQFKWRTELLVLGLLTIVTAAVFFPVTKAGLLQFDDRVHLTNNVMIRDLSPASVKAMFTARINDTYIPLTLLSFAVEYPFFGNDPTGYHVTNLLWHILNACLVYVLIRRLGFTLFSAGLTSLLFAVHPMHVESVAWITERKDVLYGFFYLLSLLSYLQFRQGGKRRFYGFALLAALLSLLAKPMAISLPLILWAIDYLQEGRLTLRATLNKIPFLIVAIGIGLITYLPHARIIDVDVGQGALIWVWCFTFYIFKFLFPVVLTPLYNLPEPISITNASYAVALVLLAGIIFAVIHFRRNRIFLFAVAFYVLSTFFLYRFDQSDINIVADRFMYLPSVGFCLLVAWLVERNLRRRWLTFAVPVVLLLLAGKTYHQTQIWNNDMTLWDYTIARGVTHDIAFNNRGVALKEAGEYALAIKDLRRALDLQRAKGFDTSETHNNIGTVFSHTGQFTQAQYAFEHAIRENPRYQTAYFNRANVYQQIGQFEDSLADYNQALAMTMDNSVDISEIHYHRGILYHRFRNFDQAAADYSEAIRRNQYVRAEVYNNRGTIHIMQGQQQAALADFEAALRIDPDFKPAQLNKEQVLRDLNKQVLGRLSFER